MSSFLEINQICVILHRFMYMMTTTPRQVWIRTMFQEPKSHIETAQLYAGQEGGDVGGNLFTLKEFGSIYTRISNPHRMCLKNE